MSDQKATVDSTSEAYELMAKNWPLIDDLRAGGRALAQKSERLIKHQRESQNSYNRRKKVARLWPIYWRSVAHIGRRPFTAQLKWTENTPAQVKLWSENIDGRGRDLRSFLSEVCYHSMGYGLRHVMVDGSEDLGRPILREVPAASVYNVEFLGNSEPGRIRLKTSKREEDASNPWNMPTIDQRSVFTRTPVGIELAVYERKDRTNSGTAFNETPTDKIQIPGSRIPIIPFPAGTSLPVPGGASAPEFLSPWGASPQLLDVAEGNLLHFNQESDYFSGLHEACYQMFYITGLTSDQVAEYESKGWGVMTAVPPGESMGAVETSGASYAAALTGLQNLERSLETEGMRPMMSKPSGQMTATGRLIDETVVQVEAEAIALSWQDSATMSLRTMWEYNGNEPEDFGVELEHDLGITESNMEKAKLIMQERAEGVGPSHLAHFRRLKELKVYGENFDPDQEAKLWDERDAAAGQSGLA